MGLEYDKKSGKKLKKVLAFWIKMLYIKKVLDTRLCELNHELRKQRKTFKKLKKVVDRSK